MKRIAQIACAITLASSLVFTTTGCTQADVDKTVALIESQIPTAIALTNTVISVVSMFGVASPSKVQTVGTTVSSDLATLQTLCAQYDATKDKTVFAKLVGLVDQIVTNGDTALLQAAAIKDPQSKAVATAALGALDTILHVIDGYVQQTQTTAQVKETAKRRQVKLSQISMYWDQQRLIKGAQNAQGSSPYMLNDPSGHTLAAAWYVREQSMGF